MKLQTILLLLIVSGCVLWMILHYQSTSSSQDALIELQQNKIKELTEISLAQYDQLKRLKEVIVSYNKTTSSFSKSISSTSKEIVTPIPTSSIPHSLNKIADLHTSFEIECENRYGLPLIDFWKAKKQTWCVNNQPIRDIEGNEITSELICYPYHQQHKKLSHDREDMFCVAKNVVIDFSKVNELLSISFVYFDLKSYLILIVYRFKENIPKVNHILGNNIWISQKKQCFLLVNPHNSIAEICLCRIIPFK